VILVVVNVGIVRLSNSGSVVIDRLSSLLSVHTVFVHQ
jgi:hypothetical protein